MPLQHIKISNTERRNIETVDEDVEEIETSCTAGRNGKQYSQFGKVCQFL